MKSVIVKNQKPLLKTYPWPPFAVILINASFINIFLKRERSEMEDFEEEKIVAKETVAVFFYRLLCYCN